MNSNMPAFSRGEKRKLRVWIQRESDAGTRTRRLILLHVSKAKPVKEVAESLHVARSTVYRVVERFMTLGWSALADRREDNGRSSVDEMYLLELRKAVAGCPQDYGWARPTWTQELLCKALEERTGVRVGQATMSRLLKQIGARLGRPRPILQIGFDWMLCGQQKEIVTPGKNEK